MAYRGFRFANWMGAALLAVLFIAAPLKAGAQEISAELLAAAREAVAASQSTASLDVILPNLGEQVKGQLISNRPDAADKINTLVDEVTISLAARRGSLEDEVARIYARIFTLEELKQVTSFYKTDAGAKLIRETPVIARSIEEAARVWSAGIQRDLQQEVQKKITEGAL